MDAKQSVKSIFRGLAAGAGLAAASYAAYAAITWVGYGRLRPPSPADRDSLLDQFMPSYEVVERHRVRVCAPAAVTFAAACESDIQDSPLIRGIFRARELILGGQSDDTIRPRGLVAQMKALGWGVLAEDPGRAIVMGAVTQAWVANVVFRSLAPEQFSDYQVPGFVKIVWTLRADPISATESVFRTETRAATTDPEARAEFRWYWAKASPGIWLIRRISLGTVRREAERRMAAHFDFPI